MNANNLFKFHFLFHLGTCLPPLVSEKKVLKLEFNKQLISAQNSIISRNLIQHLESISTCGDFFINLILQINFVAIFYIGQVTYYYMSLATVSNNIIPIIYIVLSSVYLSSPSPMESSLGICPSGWIPCSRQ